MNPIAHSATRRLTLMLATIGLAIAGGCSDLEVPDQNDFGSIEATVLDQNDQPMAGLNVVIDDNGDLPAGQRNATTSTLGKVRFDIVFSGARTIWLTPATSFSGGPTAASPQQVTVTRGQLATVIVRVNRL